MAKAGYMVDTPAAVALSAATARTALWVLAPSTFGMDLKKWRVSFDGVTASAVPVFCELCYTTGATNSTPGTNNTTNSANIIQIYGRTITTGFISGAANTAGNEPTVLTRIESTWLTPNGGVLFYDFPLGDTPDSAVSNGFAVRCTAPATVNVRASMTFERC
jgi:hypothetical protein